jgi:hypothetical protein
MKEALRIKNQLEYDVLNNFINIPTVVSKPTCQMLKGFLDNEAQGDPLEELMEKKIPTIVVHKNISVEITLGIFMNINSNLNEQQKQKFIQILSKYQ